MVVAARAVVAMAVAVMVVEVAMAVVVAVADMAVAAGTAAAGMVAAVVVAGTATPARGRERHVTWSVCFRPHFACQVYSGVLSREGEWRVPVPLGASRRVRARAWAEGCWAE